MGNFGKVIPLTNTINYFFYDGTNGKEIMDFLSDFNYKILLKEIDGKILYQKEDFGKFNPITEGLYYYFYYDVDDWWNLIGVSAEQFQKDFMVKTTDNDIKNTNK